MADILTDSRRDFQALLIVYVASFASGMMSAVIGPAWPSIRQTFGLNQDAIGAMLIAQTIGYSSASFFNGQIMLRLGTAQALRTGALIVTVVMALIALAPGWPVVIVGALLAGLGSGVLDTGLNNYVASHYRARQMNWLHASYGGGLVLGTLVMTVVLAGGLSWRLGYGLASVVYLSMALVFVLTAALWRDGLPQRGMQAGVSHARLRETLRLPMLWLSLFLIVCYSGAEATRGTWAYSILTESRGLDTVNGGLWVTISLVGFTAVRVVFGFIGDRIALKTQLRVCIVGAIAGAALLWWNPTTWAGLLGLLLVTVGQAATFALLVVSTGERVGARHTANAIGMQASAAGIGVALAPALAGVLAQQYGLEAVMPYLLALSLLVWFFYEATVLGVARMRLPERVAKEVMSAE